MIFNKSKVQIERIRNEHLDQIVEIFFEELNISILSLFGKNFIKKMFVFFIKDNLGFVSILEKNEKVIGFIFMKKKDFSLVKCLTFESFLNFITKILLSYANLKAFLISFFRLYLRRSEIVNHDKAVVELSHFALKNEYKSIGIGSALIDSLEQEAKINGFNKVFTSTHNLKLVQFYKLKKNARILSIIDVGIYKSHNVIWEIK